eukprot:CAMPEP_0116116790 /NCGR_PEP_ID=MMETSP0329-20121206/1226_1 /TAXON_ID=697910 /ORGANISM="Pseudo-nitzschia arenysensis, Strain B593" /LENGTH=304 /DNA_ID=CAMNT_0003610309 /DNA_START=47 /DNA_END=961 /DNA_ORIENTATION=+
MNISDTIMLTAVVLSFFMTLEDTKFADAFANHKVHYCVRNVHGGKSGSTAPSTIGGANYAGSCVARIQSSRLFAAKNAVKTNSKEASSSAKENKGEPFYWIDEACDHNFQITFHDENENKDQDAKAEDNPKTISKLRFKICGNPRPLQRHRTSRFHTYNPSVKYQKSFQDALEKLMSASDIGSMDHPIFQETEYLVMTLIFRMKRPKNHFVNNRPGPGRLKAKSPPQLSSIRSDVDNLTKFVLDSMNGVMYEDDRQITSIHATKLLDNEDLCTGSVEVYIRSIDVKDVDKIIESSISIADKGIQ